MTIPFPDISPASLEWRLVSNTQVFKSPLSGATQTLELPGARWAAALSYFNLEVAQLRVLSAFLVRLRGQAGTFTLHDFARPTPEGLATGTPVVSGAGQSGNTLVTTGWTTSITGILLAGDYIQVGDELKMVVADANSDGSGGATLTIEPPWRNSPANGVGIVTNQPKCIMRLADPETGWKTSPPVLTDISFNCIEVLG